MLKTLNSYIDNPAGETGPTSLGSGFIRDRRFRRLLVFSVVAHVILYALVVKLDVWVSHHRWFRGGSKSELVKLIEIAPPIDHLADLRRAPDPVDKPDLTRFKYDPEHGDDVNLVSRSPRPTVARGVGTKLPLASQGADLQKTAADSGHGNGSAEQHPLPPVTQRVTSPSLPKPETSVIAQAPLSQAAPAPPAPTPRTSNSSPTLNPQTGAQGSTHGDESETTALGLENVQAQYRAYVRSKIRQMNEKIMPRGWVADVLNKKVSADFEVRLGRGGRLVSARKVRSTGYPRLDDTANEAIYMASPFEGFPPDAGDIIILTVTVYYTPWR